MEASVLRSRARGNLAGNWGLSIGLAALAVLLGGNLTGSSFLPQISAEVSTKVPAFIPGLKELFLYLAEGLYLRMGNFSLGFREGILGLAKFLIGGTLQLGYAQFLLKQHDGQNGEFNDLFSQFHRFGQAFAQRFLRSLYVWLWSLLLVIPGIMKSYSYAMTPFLMADHPELTASQAIARSQELMDGYKMDLFILDLSFFGWTFLASLTGNIGFLVLNPYTNAARAAFYRQLLAENRCTCQEGSSQGYAG